jgi:hypothetical protein
MEGAVRVLPENVLAIALLVVIALMLAAAIMAVFG